ncbi:hypothetical protein JCM8547_007237 [Rhodosporidiobolus lusitaniae]
MTARTKKEDVLYALHTFEAENDDELSFQAGERIIVLERDDQYNDGWFQGKNTKGEVGLFPESYTSDRPPSFYPFPEDLHSGPNGFNASHLPPSPPVTGGPQPGAMFGPPATSSGSGTATEGGEEKEVLNQSSLSPASAARRLSHGSASIHSRSSARTYDDDGFDDSASLHSTGPRRPEDGAAHRAALAAKAMENAEKAAQEERERIEKRRKEDEERYEAVRRDGLIEGLELSDESDAEEGFSPLMGQKPFGAAAVEEKEDEEKEVLQEGKEAAQQVVPVGGEAVPASATHGQRPSLPETVSSSDSLDVKKPELRPRADTQPSIYAESTYSQSSSVPPVPSPPTAIADLPPLPASPQPVVTPPVSTAPLSPPEPASTSPASATSAASGMLDTLKSAASTTTAADGAAAVAAGAGVGLAVSSATEKSEPSPEPTSVAQDLPKEASTALDAAPPAEEVTAAPVDVKAAETATAPPVETAPPAVTSSSASRTITPAPLDAVSSTSFPIPPSSTAAAAPAIAPSLTASPSSAAFSRNGGGAASTAGTSAPASEAGGRELPADPMAWSVEDVVEWAKQKGFDKLTVSKFEEHEISGDVLLEMDVAMLKEIDLVAFGRRVHIYNAIKELRLRTHPELSHAPSLNPLGMSQSSSYLSPAMSGYEAGVDSPATGYVASPTMGSFTQAGQYGTPPQHGHSHYLAGLGFEEGSQGGSSLRAPSSLGQQSVSNLRASSSSARPHQRSGTAGTFDSIDNSPAPLSAVSSVPPARLPSPVPPKRSTAPTSPILEQETTAGETSATDATTSKREKKSSARPSTATSVSGRPKSIRRNTRDGKGREASDTGGETAPSSPNPSGQKKGSKSDGQKGFFGASLSALPGRTRKPPPRVPSGLLLDSDGTAPRPRPRTSNQDRSKRATRFFGFGSTSGSEKSPTSGSGGAVESVRSRASNSTLGNPREAPTTMKPKEVDPATKAMLAEKQEKVTSGNLMDKIGRPDHAGWMRKKGEKYNTWKMRFFILKGVYLYYLKSEQEQKAKGVIDLTGYRVLSDENIRPGEFGFKIVHDRGRPHYFAAAEQITVRDWMKEIMKATILRDYSAPVVSSCDIEVLPLEVAQTMTPYPRPPTPTRRAQIQKERYAGTNPNTLSQKDAAILMDFAPGSPLMNGEALWSTASSKPAKQERKSSAVSLAKSATSDTPTELAAPVGPFGDDTPKLNGSSPPLNSSTPSARLTRATSDTTKGELLAWVNANLPSSCPLATDLGFSLRSGRLLVRLLENLSGQRSEITDGQFDQFHQQEGLPFDTAYLDTIFSVFDFVSPLVSTDEISMEDMITGNEERLTLLVERMRTAYPNGGGNSGVVLAE